MKFFTRAATTALTGLVIFGFASAAFAQRLERQSFDAVKVNFLLRTATETGHTVFRGGEPCEDGVYGFATSTKQLLICVDNHGNNLDELADTVRHEAFHLAQFCKARRVGASMALIFPDLNDEALELARDLGMPMERYDERQHPFEAEARAAAFALDEHRIAAILEAECHHD